MKSVIALCVIAAATAEVPVFEKIAHKVNTANAGWTAEAPHDRFGSLGDVKKVCGTFMPGHPEFQNVTLTQSEHDVNPLQDFPENFDSRTNWPKCTVLSRVRDQSHCGSCWAFSATEAFEGRRCVATGEDTEFSPEDTAGCCHGIFCGLSNGCNGGQPAAALRWMSNTGVVTGGDYFNRTDVSGGCKPYSLAPCAHHVPATSQYPVCPSGGEPEMTCQKTCTDAAYGKDYESDKQKGTGASSIGSVEGMMTAIMKGGPLSVALTVYEDLPTYKSGVYRHTSGEALGGHAVLAVGWGVEDGTPYWLIKNSWNEMWGDGGFFKILRGSNECGIENMVTSIEF